MSPINPGRFTDSFTSMVENGREYLYRAQQSLSWVLNPQHRAAITGYRNREQDGPVKHGGRREVVTNSAGDKIGT
ncbi:hypothetical protein N8198_06565 [Gammaproteobacteria bacterium]|nr:hypothetical protein [Gammaproteobacteria bacterium]